MLVVLPFRAGRHNGCIVEAFFLSFPCCARDTAGLAKRPHFSVMGNKSCNLPSSDCGAMTILLTTPERELSSTKRWSGGQKGRVTIAWASVTHPTRLGAMESIAGVAERHSKAGVQDKGMWVTLHCFVTWKGHSPPGDHFSGTPLLQISQERYESTTSLQLRLYPV